MDVTPGNVGTEKGLERSWRVQPTHYIDKETEAQTVPDSVHSGPNWPGNGCIQILINNEENGVQNLSLIFSSLYEPLIPSHPCQVCFFYGFGTAEGDQPSVFPNVPSLSWDMGLTGLVKSCPDEVSQSVGGGLVPEGIRASRQGGTGWGAADMCQEGDDR